MHRIRDLGINVIPATMRPLEIGPGAADAAPHTFEQGYDFACAGTPGSQTCTNGTCPDDDGEAPCPEDSRGSIGCEEGTCGGGEEEHCQNQPSRKPRPHQQHVGGFSPEAVMQLQQQLEHHLGEELPN